VGQTILVWQTIAFRGLPPSPELSGGRLFGFDFAAFNRLLYSLGRLHFAFLMGARRTQSLNTYSVTPRRAINSSFVKHVT